MAVCIPDARELPDVVLEAFRLRAISALEAGFSETEVAAVLGVARETVCRWFSAYREGGVESLPHNRTGRPVGSGALLSDEQSRHIRELIDEHSPDELDIASPLWTRRAVRELIRNEFGIEIAERTVGTYLRSWNYTPKKPQRQSRQQDPEDVREWLEETYPAIEELAAEEDAEIHWCDETGAVADQHPGSGYSPKGKPATMKVPAPHIRMNQISTITNEGTVRFMTYAGTMNATRFRDFLQRLIRTTDRKIFVIADQLKAHLDDLVIDWVEANQDRISLFYLPAYSPELNPDEYLNNDLKANVNKAGLPDNKNTLRSRIQSFMKRIQRLPEHVINYFRNPHVKYASALEL